MSVIAAGRQIGFGLRVCIQMRAVSALHHGQICGGFPCVLFLQHSPWPTFRSVGLSGERGLQDRSISNKMRDSWGDTFGTLSETESKNDLAERIEESLSTTVGSHEERFSQDDDELEGKHIRLSAVNRRHIPEWYGRKILKLGKKGKIREAIDMLENTMLKKDRVFPNSYVFTCIITVLGRAGYSQKAFSLFNKMKKMGIEPKPATYTALFNACANSPWKKDGRKRTTELFSLMKEKGVTPTFITGKAMIKAFAVCGDLRQAFALVDELTKFYKPDVEVFSFLLMACISDKEQGLRHAIQVWRLMQKMEVRPDLPLYNLLVRCVRDCGVGDIESFTAELTGGSSLEQADPNPSLRQNKTPLLKGKVKAEKIEVKKPELIPAGKVQHVADGITLPYQTGTDHLKNSESSFTQLPEQISQITDCSSYVEVKDKDITERNEDREPQNISIDSQQELQNKSSSLFLAVQPSVSIPNVLSISSDLTGIVALSDLSTKENRLLLLGGVDGLLSRMAKDKAKPNIITFTQIISVAMPSVEAEEHLLARMKSMKVKPDIDFINTLIHKRCMRADFVAARAVGDLMLEYRLTANQRTYGVLAMTCKNQKDAARLLDDMTAADLAPNVEILGTLMNAAGFNFHYKLWVLQQIERLDIKPNDKLLGNVEKSLHLARSKMLEAERQGQQKSFFMKTHFHQSFNSFVNHYEAWLKETQLQVPRHPWAAFKPVSPDHKNVTSQ